MRVRTQQGDTVDVLCWRYFGRTGGIVEQVFLLNPGIADFGPVLPQGTEVLLPEQVQQEKSNRTVKLWG